MDVGRNTSLAAAAAIVSVAAPFLYRYIYSQTTSIINPRNDPLSDFILKETLHVNDGMMVLLGTLETIPTLVLLYQIPFSKTASDKNEDSKMTNKIAASISTHTNDIYSNFTISFENSTMTHKMTIISPATQSHIAKYSKQNSYHLVSETQEMYETSTVKYIEGLNPEKHRWVYNILNGKSETDRIWVNDKDEKMGFVFLPDTKWSIPHQSDGLYCLALSRDRSIRSVRDLRGFHIPFLLNVRAQCLEYIQQEFGLPATLLRIFVHYQPSYYHFHLHFVHVSITPGTGTGKAILLDTILYNLKQDGDYYMKATLPMLVGEVQHAGLFQQLVQC